MKQIFFILTVFLCFQVQAQKIIGYAMADDNGITTDQTKAKYLIIKKQLSDTVFERLDYNFAGPMISRATYKDKELSILHGTYTKYKPSGYLFSEGTYTQNKKTGDWYIYNDTAHAYYKYVYQLDSLVSVIDLDSLNKIPKEVKPSKVEIEAKYKGGVAKIKRVISKNFKVPGRTTSLNMSGKVLIRFVIDTNGDAKEIKINKSVEFAFDEECIRVVGLLKDWIPAIQDGKKVKAYRILPITVTLP